MLHATGRRTIDEQRIDQAGDGHLQPGGLADATVLDGVRGLVEIAHRWRQDDTAAQAREPIIAGESLEGRQLGQGQVDLGGRASVAEVVDLPAQLGTERLGVQQALQRPSADPCR